MSVIAGIVRFSGAPISADDLALAATRLAAPVSGKPRIGLGGSRSDCAPAGGDQ